MFTGSWGKTQENLKAMNLFLMRLVSLDKLLLLDSQRSKVGVETPLAYMYIYTPAIRAVFLNTDMINNNQLIQAAGFLFAIAIAMALSVLAFVKDILALLSFRASSTVAPEYPRIVVTVKVDVVTTQNSTIEPLSSVSSDSTFVQVSSECYSGARGGKRSCFF